MAETSKRTSWRELLKVHPAAELFSLMEGDEFKALVEDIREHGLRTVVMTWFDEAEQEWLLDGRNRLNALEELGYRFKIVKTGGYGSDRPHLKITRPDSNETVAVGHHFSYGHQVTDPYTYVISANIHRRHLTAERRKAIAAEILKRQPGRSNLSVATEVKLDDKTVATVRRELEANSEIPNKTDRIEASGRKARGRKPAGKKSAVKAEGAPAASISSAKPEAMANPAPTCEPVARQTYEPSEHLRPILEALISIEPLGDRSIIAAYLDVYWGESLFTRSFAQQLMRARSLMHPNSPSWGSFKERFGLHEDQGGDYPRFVHFTLKQSPFGEALDEFEEWYSGLSEAEREKVLEVMGRAPQPASPEPGQVEEGRVAEAAA